MMMPVAEGRAEAMGIIKAMAVIGPNPGNMPMNVPIMQPITKNERFWMVNAAIRPVTIPSIII